MEDVEWWVRTAVSSIRLPLPFADGESFSFYNSPATLYKWCTRLAAVRWPAPTSFLREIALFRSLFDLSIGSFSSHFVSILLRGIRLFQFHAWPYIKRDDCFRWWCRTTSQTIVQFLSFRSILLLFVDTIHVVFSWPRQAQKHSTKCHRNGHINTDKIQRRTQSLTTPSEMNLPGV